MSVLIIGKFKGDTAKFRQAMVDRAGEFAKIAGESKTVGALHHRFGVGDGYVVIVDEWESVEHFQKFMADPDLQAFIGSVGGAPEPPEVIVAEAITSPDQFLRPAHVAVAVPAGRTAAAPRMSRPAA